METYVHSYLSIDQEAAKVNHFDRSDGRDGNGGILLERGCRGGSGGAVAFWDGRGGNGGEEGSLTTGEVPWETRSCTGSLPLVSFKLGFAPA